MVREGLIATGAAAAADNDIDVDVGKCCGLPHMHPLETAVSVASVPYKSRPNAATPATTTMTAVSSHNTPIILPITAPITDRFQSWQPELTAPEQLGDAQQKTAAKTGKCAQTDAYCQTAISSQ